MKNNVITIDKTGFDFTAGISKCLAGEELSGADFQMVLALQLASARCDMSPYHHIKKYIEQVESIESYQKAMKKLG